MSTKISKKYFRADITNSSALSQQKIINYQEIISLKKLLRPEVRQVKGKEYTDAYLRVLEKQNKKLIKDSLHYNEITKSLQKNQLFQKMLDKTKKKNNKNKIIMRNQSQNDLLSTCKFQVISKNINSSSNNNINDSSVKKTERKKIKKTLSLKSMNNSNYKSTYWEDYDFFKTNEHKEKENVNINKISCDLNTNIIFGISEKGTSEEQTSEKMNKIKYTKNNNNTTNDDIKNQKNDNYLEKYYLYLLKRRQKRNKLQETDEENKNDKKNVEIMRKILNHIFNDDELPKIWDLSSFS
jgi:hypothetical protein